MRFATKEIAQQPDLLLTDMRGGILFLHLRYKAGDKRFSQIIAGTLEKVGMGTGYGPLDDNIPIFRFQRGEYLEPQCGTGSIVERIIGIMPFFTNG